MFQPAAYTLSPSMRLRVLALQESAEALHTEADFLAWARGPLQALLPHECLACGVVGIQSQGTVLHRVLTQGWPQGYMNALTLGDGRFRSPVLQRWAAERVPQIVLTRHTEHFGDPIWSDVFEDMQLRNMLSHGVQDWGSDAATYVCLARMPVRPAPEHAALMRLLTPHMAQALRRVLAAPVPQRGHAEPTWLSRLTERERVVLHWMRQGKTNWEIAQICCRSQHTIKNQVERVRQKLDASNRAQACALAADVPLLNKETPAFA